jgi:uncharacterized protein YqgV (UPF0045/DUF77 family)
MTTYTVTEGTLRNFAAKELASFLNSATENGAIKELLAYVTGKPGVADSVDRYTDILAGAPGVLREVESLEKNFTSMSTSLQTNLKALFKLVKDMRNDLRDVDRLLDNGEADATLTAENMITVLGNVWTPTSGNTFTIPLP